MMMNDEGFLESPMETLVDLVSLSTETGVWCFSLSFKERSNSWVRVRYMGPFMSRSKKTSKK
jgi:hypothetical protein